MRTRPEANHPRTYFRPRPLRIILMANRWWTGGAEVMLAKLVESFRAQGHDAFCCFLYDRSDGGNPPPSGTRFLIQGRFRLGSILAAARHLLALFGRPRPDIVLTFHPKASLLAQLLALGARVPGRIASQRNVADAEKPWLRWMDGFYGSLGLYTRIAMVSCSTADTFSAWPAAYRRRMKVLPNGIVPLTFAADDVPAWTGRPLLVAVGRLAPQKNHTFLLEVLAELPQAHLAIAGDGPERDRLQAQVTRLGLTDRVHFCGTLSRDRVNALVARADVFAMPSLFEGMSNALLEALAIGTPIVASDVPAQREVLVDAAGRAAGVVLPLHKAAWVSAIQDVLDHPALRQSYREQALRRARDFTMDRCVTRYLALMRHLVPHQVRQPRTRRSLAIAGRSCDLVQAPAALQKIIRTIEGREPLLIANHNVNSLVRSLDSQEMQQFYRLAHMTLIDGMPLIWWARILGFHASRRHRVCWLDHLDVVFAEAANHGWKICHIGGRPGVGDRARADILARHPALQLVTCHGHFAFPGPEADAVLAEIHRIQPRILLVGMGMPRQEEWIAQYWSRLPACVVVTTGGTFDVYAGVTPNAPRWLGPLGLEWAFRILTEPRRLWRRYLVDPWRLVPHLLRDLRRGRRR